MKLGELIWIGEKKTALRVDLENRYALVVVRSGKQAVQAALKRLPQAIVVDQTSLKSGGARLCSNLRRALGDAVPLLIVGGASAQEAKASQLALSNPSIRQLMTALRRLTRTSESSFIVCGAFALDAAGGRLRVDGREIQLSPKKAKLLTVFFCHPNQVVERAHLMQEVWQTQYTGDTRTLNVYIRWVRQVLADSQSPLQLETVRGRGYRLLVKDKPES